MWTSDLTARPSLSRVEDLWTDGLSPGARGVEVCACPSEEEQLQKRADEVEEDIERLRRELDDLKPHKPGRNRRPGRGQLKNR